MTLINQLIEVVSKYGRSNLFTNWSLIDIARIIRNSFLIIINGYSLLVPLILIIFIVYWIKNKKWPEIVFFLSFFIPFFLTAKFWYGGLYGRYSSFVGYGLALLIALISNKKLYWLTILTILLVFIPCLIAYQQIPYPQAQRQIIKQTGFSKNNLLILSDYQRPHLTYKNALYINGDKNEQKIIEDKINQALKNKQRILISEQAITFPYWQYDGQQIHIISKGDIDKAVMKKFLQNKKLIKVASDKNCPLLSVYQIKKR